MEYYILHDYTQDLWFKTQIIQLSQGGQQLVLARDVLYGAENTYILPKQNGIFIIAGRVFFRNDTCLGVKIYETY